MFKLSTEMTNYDVVTKNAELSYDVCEKCGSLWVDRGELDKMAFQVAASIEFCSEEEAKLAKKASRNCPRCLESQLTPVRFLDYRHHLGPLSKLLRILARWR